MAKWEHKGGGRVDVFQKKETDWDSIFGGIALAVIAIIVIVNL